MDFIIGGKSQGKYAYAISHYRENQIVSSYEEVIKAQLMDGKNPLEEVKAFVEKNPDAVILMREVGGGIVPMDPFERTYREVVGQCGCYLAKQAKKVIRMHAKIPMVLKQEGIELLFIRHGKTAGNLEKRYIGATDEPLCDEGRRELEKKDYGKVDIVFVSPMIRCKETAKLLFPEAYQIVVSDFRECDFGDFEGKNYKELSGNPSYQKWIDSMGSLPFPNGESQDAFQERVRNAFLEQMRFLETLGDRRIAFVVHGGTIMSILSGFDEDKKDYFEYQVDNADGYKVLWNGEKLECCKQLSLESY